MLADTDHGGAGVPVLLLHAIPVDSRMWDDAVAQLGDDVCAVAVAVDLPGLGGSALPEVTATMEHVAREVLGVLDELGIDRAVVVGLSTGGYVAAELAREHPDRLRGLGLASTTTRVMAPDVPADRREVADEWSARGRWTPSWTPGVAWLARAIASRADTTDAVRGVPVPVLLLFGEEDVATPPARAHELAAVRPDAELVLLARTGHLTALERPAQVATPSPPWPPAPDRVSCKYYRDVVQRSATTTARDGRRRSAAVVHRSSIASRRRRRVRRTIERMEQWWVELAEHDGLVLRDRVLGSGVDPDQLVLALRTGRLFRVQRGVYGVRSAPPSSLARARAAILSSGVEHAVASHQTAARVHGLAVPSYPRAEHVTVLRDQRRVRRRDLHFHGRNLALGDVVVRDRVPLTTVARTVVDLVGRLPRLEAVWCADDALRRRVVDRRALDRACTRRGTAIARERITRADGLAESILETAGRLALQDAGVVLPVAQYCVRDDDGALIARVDGAYPELKLAIEFDGQSVHSAPEAVFRDRRRQNDLELAGWRVLRFTWWDVVHDTPRFVATARSALLRAVA